MELHKQRGCGDENQPKTAFYETQEHMVLDGVTLANLDLLFNATTNSVEGTLLNRLDCTRTQFGKRLLRQWLCAPLCHPGAIRIRQNAISSLLRPEYLEIVSTARARLSKLPDLQRLLAKIHGVGANRPQLNHPDSRAVLFEEKIYSKRKCADFLATIQGFQVMNAFMWVLFFSLGNPNIPQELWTTSYRSRTITRRLHEVDCFMPFSCQFSLGTMQKFTKNLLWNVWVDNIVRTHFIVV